MSQRASLVLSGGYGDRVWLSVEEWQTYRKRVAVRYPQKSRPDVEARDGDHCSVCGKRDDEGERRIQLAHRVPFRIGVVDWGLTPDWLDDVNNLCLAHQGACNNKAEIRKKEIPTHLQELGLNLDKSPAVLSGVITVKPDTTSGRVEFCLNPKFEDNQ